ncbi:hypothetical protein IHE44_0004420 [Lamprotornis superbus]|uniref:Cytokine-like nuclear factor N-PAC n=1 Tax=Lamprotornis superbus TaxID=245042 RepID=A0A835TSP1_9PASS|nr:hypothetical protein IHE44_0004420 [Lamprotornis superbus]
MAAIVNPPKDLKKPRGKKCFFVKFFGTEDHAWIKVEQLKPYHPHKEEMIKINKGKRFQQAVDAVEEFLRKTKGKDQASSHNSTEEKNRRNSSEERGKQSAGEEKRKASLSEGKVKKGTGEGKKRVSSVSSERGSKSPLKRAQDQSPRKRGRPPKDEKDLTIPESSTVKRVMTGTVAGFKWPPSVSEPVKDSDPHFHHFLLSQTEKPAVCYQAITKKLKVCEEETGSTSIQAADSTAVNGSITPTDKKIGFLGLGLMGSGIVSNLLKMGHTVTVWNRTAEKCDLFIQEGARLGRTPAEVVSTCDITFACVSDPKAAKDLVLGPSGVLQGIRPGKCYVDMSTVDADTVTELAQVIVSRGGRFLEAPVSGNQQLSNDGMLVILAAGDRGLYEDCSSCFQAMGKTSFFLGEVGNAAKMMLIVNMVQGSFMATIAEGLTLAQVTGQSQQTLLDILNQGQLASIFLDQKCQNILQGNFKPDFYLKYIQKDLRLAIALGDSVNHPTPMAAAANEVYKRAKALDQSDNDMSAMLFLAIPFLFCCEIMQVLDSLHQGDRVTYIPSTCEYHLSPWSQSISPPVMTVPCGVVLYSALLMSCGEHLATELSDLTACWPLRVMVVLHPCSFGNATAILHLSAIVGGCRVAAVLPGQLCSHRCAQEEQEETKSSHVAVKRRDGNGGIQTLPDAASEHGFESVPRENVTLVKSFLSELSWGIKEVCVPQTVRNSELLKTKCQRKHSFGALSLKVTARKSRAVLAAGTGAVGSFPFPGYEGSFPSLTPQGLVW